MARNYALSIRKSTFTALCALVSCIPISALGAEGPPVSIDSALSTDSVPTEGREEQPTIHCTIWPRGTLECDTIYVVLKNISEVPKAIQSCQCDVGLDEYMTLEIKDTQGETWKVGEQLTWTKQGDQWMLSSALPPRHCVEKKCGFYRIEPGASIVVPKKLSSSRPIIPEKWQEPGQPAFPVTVRVIFSDPVHPMRSVARNYLLKVDHK